MNSIIGFFAGLLQATLSLLGFSQPLPSVVVDQRTPPGNGTELQYFATPTECEKATGKRCTYWMCDLVPEGKTYEEVCPHGSYWAPAQETKSSATSNKEISGNFFKVSYPADFTAHPIYPNGQANRGDSFDEATFTSPDGAVEFFVYAPQWSGEPSSYKEAAPNEKLESDTSTPSVKTETNANGTTYYKKITRYVTFAAKDGSYKRSYAETTSGWVTDPDSTDFSSKTTAFFGIKYKDQATYDKYKDKYLAFKASLVQYAD